MSQEGLGSPKKQFNNGLGFSGSWVVWDLATETNSEFHLSYLSVPNMTPTPLFEHPFDVASCPDQRPLRERH